MAFKVFIAGTKYFGCEVLRICIANPDIEVVGVSAPVGGEKEDKVHAIARRFEIPIVPAGTLSYDTLPEGLDLGIAAHSHDFVGKRSRYKPVHGWIGYHPSLLPRHRGRDAVKWTIKMGDAIAGGSIYWLNSGVDRGDIAAQEFCHVGRNETPRQLWEDKLCPIGLNLMKVVLKDIMAGNIVRVPQDQEYDTWEPSLDNKEIYRPDLVMIPEKCGPTSGWVNTRGER